MSDFMEDCGLYDELQVAPVTPATPANGNPQQPAAPKVPGNIPVGSPMDAGFVTIIPNGEHKKYICNIDYFVSKADPYFHIVHLLGNAVEGDEVIFNIFSYGGSVCTGCMIINAIMNTKAKVTTVAYGLCASIAAMIWSCGHDRVVEDNATIMYHMPSGCVYGKTADNEEESRHIQSYFAEFMAEVTKGILTKEELDKIIGRRMDLFLPADTIKARMAVMNNVQEGATNE